MGRSQPMNEQNNEYFKGDINSSTKKNSKLRASESQ